MLSRRFLRLLSFLVVLCMIAFVGMQQSWQNHRQYHRNLFQLKGKGIKVEKSRKRSNRLKLHNAHQDPSKLHRRTDQALAALRSSNYASLQNSTLFQNSFTFYSIFAGRKDPLEIQLSYVQKMLNDESIDEVHIWDYTCKQYATPPQTGKNKIYKMKGNMEQRPPTTEAILNAQYLRKTVLELDPRIFIVKPELCIWEEYYNFYSQNMRSTDVLIKADDDIVFVDTRRMKGFVETIRRFPEVFLWSANVINNGMAAVFQKNDGVLPRDVVDTDAEVVHFLGESCLFRRPDKGRQIHELFLENPEAFLTPLPGKELRRVRSRLSINFVAFLGKNMDQAAKYVTKADGDDETGLTQRASGRAYKETLMMYMPLVASHASFSPQRMGYDIYQLYSSNQERLHEVINNGQNDTWSLPHEIELPVKYNV